MTEKVYGKISGIKRFAVHDGDGIRTTVFFKGCPLRCVWCHNPEAISFAPQMSYHAHKCIGCGECLVCPADAVSICDGKAAVDRDKCNDCGKCAEVCIFSAREYFGETWDSESLAEKLSEDKAFFRDGGGVTLSGGECLAQMDFALALLKELKKRELNTAVDTCGYIPFEIFEKVMPYTDTFLYDIKAIDGEVHKKCTGRDNSLILSNLEKLCLSGCDICVRIPLVVGMNDGEIVKIAEFLKDKPIRRVSVLKYHDLARSKYVSLGMSDTMPTPLTEQKDVTAAVELLRSYGISAVDGKDD